ncbi:MAG: 1-acyl-sn-glycerol-3-phosphate acyltransferase [Bdellovibrionales bacterium]
MKRAYIRSILYNIAFYGLTAVACVVCLPALILPRRMAMGVVYAFVHINAFLERWVLGLRYAVRGLEHVPKPGPFIIAAKHQSAYETMKLHILFRDPAVILKKELLHIPLWGWYLRKSDVIAIDRSTPDAAIQSIQSGAQRMKDQGRPIVIFPQGTRVAVGSGATEKPYKVGVARVQEATDLPIIPLAMNSGMFWPRNGFWKSSGTVLFEFLPAIAAGQDRTTVLKTLEHKIEAASESLMDEARQAQKPKRFSLWGLALGAVLIIAAAGYTLYWLQVAKRVEHEFITRIDALNTAPFTYYGERIPPDKPVISGFPFKMKLYSDVVKIRRPDGVLTLHHVRAESWPFPHMVLHVAAEDITLTDMYWEGVLGFNALDADIIPRRERITIVDALLKSGDFEAQITGDIDLRQSPYPKPDLVFTLVNHESLIADLVRLKVLEDKASMFLTAGLNALKAQNNGVLAVPLYQRGDTISVGPLPVYTFMKTKAGQHRSPSRQPPTTPSP